MGPDERSIFLDELDHDINKHTTST